MVFFSSPFFFSSPSQVVKSLEVVILIRMVILMWLVKARVKVRERRETEAALLKDGLVTYLDILSNFIKLPLIIIQKCLSSNFQF